MPIDPQRQSDHGSDFQASFSGAIERAETAELVFEVGRGDTFEPGHPGPESYASGRGILR